MTPDAPYPRRVYLRGKGVRRMATAILAITLLVALLVIDRLAR